MMRGRVTRLVTRPEELVRTGRGEVRLDNIVMHGPTGLAMPARPYFLMALVQPPVAVI